MEKIDEDKKSNGIYQQRVRCSNCGYIQDERIPMGKTIENYLKGTDCENCGCKTLERNLL